MEYTNKHLETALELAMAAHRGQSDLGGQPYILHSIRVMAKVARQHAGRLALIVALLHDVFEDGSSDIESLRSAGFDDAVMIALDALTRGSGSETYVQYIDRVKRNKIACLVKLADLEDNMDATRLPWPLSNKDLERLFKYRSAWRSILASHGRLLNES
jgi:(p)ppGpp synthase/HD superfamily hydrolase